MNILKNNLLIMSALLCSCDDHSNSDNNSILIGYVFNKERLRISSNNNMLLDTVINLKDGKSSSTITLHYKRNLHVDTLIRFSSSNEGFKDLDTTLSMKQDTSMTMFISRPYDVKQKKYGNKKRELEPNMKRIVACEYIKIWK